jgi:hypothetical protein
VVLGVVQLHDLAGDVRLECAVIICVERGHQVSPIPCSELGAR